MGAAKNALPRLTRDGAENSDEIVAAILKYRQSHSAAETEAAVHAWYDEYDAELGAAIQENLDLKSLREENVGSGYEMCRSEDYEKCQKIRQAEYVGARHDQTTMSGNSARVVRIQHAFMKIRGDIMRCNLRYDWFKIRTTNGIDKY
jgi:hypothetical protein